MVHGKDIIDDGFCAILYPAYTTTFEYVSGRPDRKAQEVVSISGLHIEVYCMFT